ncbi:polysaccharide lyase family 7 protein [Aquimarina aggregata]|uniref:polysaccharide lyase family 7 protein n=1 Tax=Aquimarina aggregata TaxID=1642818 RepID=UPI00249268AE|nr:polysaccharide lyase family 7 protein [Aquimarina aggregata]
MKISKLRYIPVVVLFIFSLTNCSSDNDEPENQEQDGGDTTDGDVTDGDGETTSDIPYEVLELKNWKITLPRDFNNDGIADEVYLDKSRNDFEGDPSFKTYKDEFFFVKNKNVLFSCPSLKDIPTTGNSSNTRSELREMPSDESGEKGWDANDNSIKTLDFKVKIVQTSSTKKFAFAQIHDFKQDVWDDILRVQIQSDKPNAIEGDTGRIYLLGDVIEGKATDGFPIDFRNSNYADRYIKDDYVLGEWLTIKITIQNSILKIYLEDMNMPIRTYTNITCKSNYYKAGVYNQSVNLDSNGNGIAEFSEINISENF